MRKRDKEMLERNVQRGVKWLNENPEAMEEFEEWYSRVNINTLNMKRGDRCMIGQLAGDYVRGLTAIGVSKGKARDNMDYESVDLMDPWAIRHGFLIYYRNTTRIDFWDKKVKVEDTEWVDEAYAYLTQLWRDAILNEQLERSIKPVVGLTEV